MGIENVIELNHLLAIAFLLFYFTFANKIFTGIATFELSVALYIIVITSVYLPQSSRFILNFDYPYLWEISRFSASYPFGYGLEFGIDSLSITFSLLTTSLVPTAVLVPIKETKNSTAFYYVFLLAVELVLVLTFLSLSVFIFFFCFEVILLLTYILLYYWGSRLRKIRSSFYLLIFTIFGSSLLLFGILFLLQIAGSTDLTLLDNFHFSVDQQKLLAFLFAVGFGVKLPVFPLAI